MVALVGALVESKTRLTKNDGKELRTMTLEEYFVSPPRLVKPPDSKVLWHEDALAEADLLEVRQVLGSADFSWTFAKPCRSEKEVRLYCLYVGSRLSSGRVRQRRVVGWLGRLLALFPR